MRYALNYIVTDLAVHPSPPYTGKGWSVTFEPLELIDHNSRQYVTDYGDHEEIGKVVIIDAASYGRAFAVARLIHAAHCVLDGSNIVHEFADDYGIVPYPVDRSYVAELGSPENQRLLAGSMMSRSGTPLACMLAAKTSFRRRRQYALFKLYQSYRQYSTHWTDLDPSLSATLPRSKMPENHVAFAQAITLAYGVIEELGLEVRASSQGPSRDSTGRWNSKVKQNLEDRLTRAHIQVSETIDWSIRGPRTRLEKGRRTQAVDKTSWAYGMVRDVEIQLIDAIADLSWLRSEIAAHKFSDRKEGELVSLLSPYDVANAQSVACRLLLESLGFWRC